MPSYEGYSQAQGANRRVRGLVIGLAGEKQSGKDTMADYLVQFEHFEKLSFAKPMKQSSAAALGTSVETLERLKENPLARVQLVEIMTGDNDIVEIHSDISVREFWQNYGTEAHRKIPEFGEDVWTDMMVSKLDVPGAYVIPDARFENEQRLIKAAGGYVVHIVRPRPGRDDGHASEKVDHGLADFSIVNDSSLDDFCLKVEETLTAIRRVHHRP